MDSKAHGIAHGTAIGTQGQVIMHADDTGVSAFNHLHVHVMPNAGPANNRPVRGQFTIPFVFSDVGDHVPIWWHKGVPRWLDWYKSDNEKQA